MFANEFIGNIAYYGGAVYRDSILLGLNSTNNVFLDNSAYEGGAIYKKSSCNFSNYVRLNNDFIIAYEGKSFLPSTLITKDIYIGNTAIRAGGAIHANWESLLISQTQFLSCSAYYGGALYIKNLGKIDHKSLI